MVHIPFPRTELDKNVDLISWRNKVEKREGDWGNLKDFLCKQAKFDTEINRIPKCWYSELPQGDNYALDVEHFRPKNNASPLTEKQIKKIERLSGIKLLQNEINSSYPWIEFDYRNYRLVTAFTNRGGAKHIYFPLAYMTNRLNNNEMPWVANEYPLLLDPVNSHDAKQLLVLGNGQILPRAPKTQLSDNDYNNINVEWNNNGFNYLRSWITIVLYRLDDNVLIIGRSFVYKQTQELIGELLKALKLGKLLVGIKDLQDNTEYFIRQLSIGALPCAQFALAARCAIEAYPIPENEDLIIKQELNFILQTILRKINELSDTEIDWNNS